jgi:RNA-binding protein
MDDLTSRQRAHLRSLAHHLKPLVHIGAGGLTDAALQGILDAFRTRELLKVKVLEASPLGARETGENIAASLDGVLLVQTIGRIAVLYRPHPEKPEIRLPGR